ncbi:MAG: PorP/SprF family type IX secretion system membrane protein [Bacteroidales bacterium]
MTHTYKKIIIYTLLTIICQQIVAQDIHFTQYDAQPLSINPAETGWYKGDIRAAGIYRTQWKAIDNKEYRTIGLSIEKKFHHYLNTYSVGIQLINDQTGYVDLNVNKLQISGGYSTKLDGHGISGGIQVGGIHKSTKIEQFTFDEQFDLGGEQVFNPSLPISEINQDPISYITINSGVQWDYKLTKRFTPELGFAILYINTPHESFYSFETSDTHIPIQKVIHAGGEILVNTKIKLKPLMLYMNQIKATNFLIGGTAHYSINKKITAYGGAMFRYSWASDYDASAFRLGVEYDNFNLGVSYDVNISTLQPATHNRGAFEISLIYITKSLQQDFIKIPCDRQ